MPQRGERLLICPGCTMRGVSLRLTTSEDYWGCRYCDWEAFAEGEDNIDRLERRRLAKANPDRVVWASDIPFETQ